jgi:hypothetical protein
MTWYHRCVTSLFVLTTPQLLLLLLLITMYPASQPSDDPLRARAFEFWKHQFLPELTQSTVASETEKREGEEEQTSVVVYASAAALEVIKWSCPGGVATLYDAGVSSVKCLDEVFELQTNQVLDEIRQVFVCVEKSHLTDSF